MGRRQIVQVFKMEPHEIALSDVHIGNKTSVTGKSACSTFSVVPEVTDTGQTEYMDRFSVESLELPNSVSVSSGMTAFGDICKYQIYTTDFTYEKESNPENETGDHQSDPEYDEDGDLILSRKSKKLFTITIEHTLGTRLVDVGLQVWKGCLLLCDFILAHPSLFDNKMVLELGAGVGLASIVAATTARKVICTDIGDYVLDRCVENAERNRNLYKYCCSAKKQQNVILVRELDWTKKDLPTKGPYSWSKGDVLLDEVASILAADVIYKEELTEDLFHTIYQLMSTASDKVLYLAVERRLNFTMDDLEVSCPAYSHFIECVEELCQRGAKIAKRFKAEQLSTDFPQYLRYERSKYLVLWKISSESLVNEEPAIKR